MRLLAGGRALELATVAAIVGGTLLIVSEFLDLYSIVGAGGGVLDHVSGGSNHGYALAVIGLAVLAAVALARATGQWQPAVAGAALAVIALLVVLAGDLPDASASGLTRSRQLGEAQVAVGFWVELAAALLALGGAGAAAYLIHDTRRGSSYHR
jgi:hypothetical protein